jgi:hypothetical protein
VEVHPLSGAKIEDIEQFFLKDKACSGPFSTITVLAGTNNIASGDICNAIYQKYESLIKTIRRTHQECELHMLALPPRHDNMHNANMVPLINRVLFDVCKLSKTYLIPCQVSDTARSFDSKGLHLSAYGTAALACRSSEHYVSIWISPL